jgi:hypothetical protein
MLNVFHRDGDMRSGRRPVPTTARMSHPTVPVDGLLAHRGPARRGSTRTARACSRRSSTRRGAFTRSSVLPPSRALVPPAWSQAG